MKTPWLINTPSLPGDEHGRTVIETILSLVLIAILLLIVIDRYSGSVRIIKENALVVELSNLRSAVNLYVMLKGKLPRELKDLLKENVILPKSNIMGREHDLVIASRFVESMTVDEEGRLLDAFGNRFDYDPSTGRVLSTTSGYETW